jgi:hypothetical protein
MRSSVALAAVLLALLGAPGGSAGISPQLVISSTSTSLSARGDTTIDLETPAGMTGTVTIYAPPGYSARLDRPVGTRVGEVLSAVARVDGAEVALAGSLIQADPGTAVETGCSPGSHAAVWALTLSGTGLDVSVPVVLDPVVAAPESTYASYRLEACLGELRLSALTVKLDGVFGNPGGAGDYVWRALVAAGPPEPEIELRSEVLVPVTMSMSGRYEASSKRALLQGVLTAAGRPVVGAPVTVSSGNGVSMRTVTDGRGRFAVERPIRAATTFRASTSVAAVDVTGAGCADPIAAGGCVGAVVGPFTAQSHPVRVAPPPAPVLRLGSRGASVRRLQERLVSLRYLPWGAASGVFDERTWHAVVAFQGWQRLGRDGVVAAKTWQALERAHTPVGPGDFGRGLVVDTSRQVLLLVAGGRVQRAIHVSTAAPGHWTPHGRFRVYRKEILSWSVPFRAWMPYANYFTGGFAIHGFASVPSYPASHGCIRVPMAEAPIVYSFAGYGTPVLVR